MNACIGRKDSEFKHRHTLHKRQLQSCALVANSLGHIANSRHNAYMYTAFFTTLGPITDLQPCPEKKGATLLCQMPTDFYNSFTGLFSGHGVDTQYLLTQ